MRMKISEGLPYPWVAEAVSRPPMRMKIPEGGAGDGAEGTCGEGAFDRG